MKPTLLQWEELDTAQRLAIKAMCEASFEYFMRIAFQILHGQKFLMNWHHRYECQLAEDVYHGKETRMIVNVAPGSTKTEIWSIHWPAWCIAKCSLEGRSTRWLPLSYSDDLVTENSGRVKEILESEFFNWCWPMRVSNDTRGKSDWKFIDANNNKHRMFGTSIGGQVMGRRAGYMEDGFTGALIADDPLPTRDMLSKKVVEKSNNRMNRVVRSRLAHDGVPIVMVQQRICKGDTTDFLMSDKAPDDYTIYRVPALINREYVDKLSKEMREALIEDTGFTGERCSYWPSKEPTSTLLKMEKADPYMFSCQYQQDPDEKLSEGVVYKKEVEAIIEDGRFCQIPVEPSLPVWTFWDLGINDDMAIWLMQPFRKELRLIACFHGRDHGIEYYINWLHDFKDKYGIRYEKHIGPHDLAVRELFGSNGEDRITVAKRMGIKFTKVDRVKIKRDAHDALRRILPRVVIDNTDVDFSKADPRPPVSKGCSKGWEALKTLRREYDPDNETFTDRIIPKWATNFTDALEQMALHYKEQTKTEHHGHHHTGSGGWLGH